MGTGGYTRSGCTVECSEDDKRDAKIAASSSVFTISANSALLGKARNPGEGSGVAAGGGSMAIDGGASRFVFFLRFLSTLQA